MADPLAPFTYTDGTNFGTRRGALPCRRKELAAAQSARLSQTRVGVAPQSRADVQLRCCGIAIDCLYPGNDIICRSGKADPRTAASSAAPCGRSPSGLGACMSGCREGHHDGNQ